jgi:glycosyltransferase involved in cell wall biosynthesis
MNDLTTARFRNPTKNAIAFTLKQQIYKWVNKKVAKKATQIITYTNFVKQDIVQYTKVSPDKITTTYLSADKISDSPEIFEAAQGKRFLLYVGRPQPHKNLQRLIDAYALAKQENPELHLVLAGKFDQAYQLLKEYAEKQEITDIVFTDWITDGQLRWLYEHATAYVFPSLSEGFGLPGLEAMHYDLPVISSNATCLPEVYGDAAAYFDPLNTQEMANTITKVLAGEQLRNNLVKNGQEQLKKYSWQHTAEQTLAVYEKALK